MVKILDKVKDLSTIGIVDLSAAAISAIFWFYVASLLGPKDYGEISYIIAIAQISSTVSLLGAPHVLIVYTAKNVRIHSALYALTLLIGTAISIILFLFFFNILCNCMYDMPSSNLKKEKKIDKNAGHPLLYVE